MQSRLGVLRAHDTHGYFASDKPATGSDQSGAVTVTVDPTNRVTSVVVSGLDDELREPAGLDRRVRQAAAVARARRLEDSRPADLRAERDTPPVPRRPSPTRHRIANLMRSGRQPELPDFAEVRRLRLSPVAATTGISRNTCVTVLLGPGSSDGDVSADPGWLATASIGQISNAVTQAFDDAYGKRDSR